MKTTDQKSIFLESEGDQWFQRNVKAVGDAAYHDKVVDTLQVMGIRPGKILEIGCGTGHRLEKLRQLYQADCCGLDPSSLAVKSAGQQFPQVDFRVGTADELPYADQAFDLVIFGFCLYLCDRKDLFRIAWQADRVLREYGHLVIYDFYSAIPYRNAYSHHQAIASHKMDYNRLFLWNPAYYMAYHHIFLHQNQDDDRNPDARVAVSIIGKDSSSAFPMNPYAIVAPGQGPV